jgi:hypothetical protein
MNRAIRLATIASSAIATCVGWDAAVQAQTAVASSQQAQTVSAQQPQVVTVQQQPQLVTVQAPQLVTVQQQPQVFTVQGTQWVSTPQTQNVMAAPLFKKHMLPRLSLARVSTVQASSAPVTTQLYTVSTGQTVSSGNYLVASSFASLGRVESVSSTDAPHLTRFVDASGNSLGGLLKGFLRQFMQLNGGTSNQSSLLGIGKLFLNAVLPFLTNTGGFDFGQAIPEIEKIIESLLNEGKTPTNGSSGGQVQLAPGTYPFTITDSSGKTTQGTIAIGAIGTPDKLVTPDGGPHPNPSPDASNPADRGTPAPDPGF